MKWIPVILLGLAGCTGLSPHPPAVEPIGPQTLLTQWTAALESGSLTDVLACYRDANDTLAIQSTGRIRRGLEEIRGEYSAAFQEVTFEAVRLEDLAIRQSGDTAWATCRFLAHTRRKADGSSWALEITTSFVLNRIEDRWQIVLEQSTPIAGIPRVRRRE